MTRAKACERPILAFLQDCKHSLAIWHLRLGSLNWILIIHCTVWYQRKLTLLKSWKLQPMLNPKAWRKFTVSFQKCWALCTKKKPKPTIKVKALSLSFLFYKGSGNWVTGVQIPQQYCWTQSTHRFESVLGNPLSTHLLEGNDHAKPIISWWALSLFVSPEKLKGLEIEKLMVALKTNWLLKLGTNARDRRHEC